jgi:hypothetical protein
MKTNISTLVSATELYVTYKVFEIVDRFLNLSTLQHNKLCSPYFISLLTDKDINVIINDMRELFFGWILQISF